MPRTYVDNAYNRSCGRVGMTHGTAVMSRSSGGGGGSSSSYGGGGGGRTYVDNSMNRSLGRVGLELGTAVHSSKSSSSYGASGSSDSSRTYVDNASNRALGRVGLPHGSAVHSTSNSNSYSSSSGTRTYVDNSQNRSLGRVGLPLGSAVHSTASPSSPGKKISYSSTSGTRAGCYVDNAYNRRLGRVGLFYGEAVASKNSTSSTQNSKAGTGGPRRYVDNPMNRKLGRVGKVVGTAPVSSSTTSRMRNNCSDEVFRPLIRIDPEDNNLRDILIQIQDLRDELINREIPDPVRERNAEAAIGIVNRHEAALTGYRRGLQMPEWVRGGEVIDFKDIALGEKLGSGGFGDVHVGIWKGNLQVAIKKLRVQRVSQQRKEDFQKEVKIFSSLSHPCIIKFFGACVTPPNLAIVMEFMGGGSLHDVLHVEQRALGAEQKSQMVNDMLSALKYMHERKMAHRDIKSMNIMVCDDYAHCKIGDFGLALKEEARSSASVADHSVVGTLVYSPPEVVAGNRLTVDGLMSADVYSMTIVIIELLTGAKPYDRMNQHQVRAAILNHEQPSMASITGINDGAKDLLRKGMSIQIERRPSAAIMYTTWNNLTLLNQIGRLTLTDPLRSISGSGNGQGSIYPVLSRGLSDSSSQPGSPRTPNQNQVSSTSIVSGSGSSSSSTASRQRRSCPVCREQGMNYAFRCGHGVCEMCLLRLHERDNANCPICRGSIENPLHLFFS